TRTFAQAQRWKARSRHRPTPSQRHAWRFPCAFSLISIEKRMYVASQGTARKGRPCAAVGRRPYHAPDRLANELFVLFVEARRCLNWQCFLIKNSQSLSL